MEPGETTICEIKRHPIGLFGIYFLTAVIVLLGLAGVAAIPHVVTDLSSQAKTGIVVGAVFLILLAFLYMYIGTLIYKANRWVITSDSLTQIARRGLFDSQASQLSMGNLEDITAEQNGPLAHMFNYGVLRAETAGESSKFYFLYCPNPNYYAQQILGARERFEQTRRGEDLQRPYRAEDAYAPAPQTNPELPTQQPPAGPPIS